jgi:hypothetical protein
LPDSCVHPHFLLEQVQGRQRRARTGVSSALLSRRDSYSYRLDAGG